MTNTENRKIMSGELGEFLKKLRLQKHYTLVDVGNLVNLSPQAVGLFEKAKRMPSVQATKAFAKAFSVDENELLTLREIAVINTNKLHGEDTPAALKNEFSAIASKYKILGSDVTELSNEDLFKAIMDYQAQKRIESISLTEDEIELARKYILAMRQIKS